ncbi:hypothetical protein AAFC00_003982 [Neodothiora populina]|uniref:NADH-cytochrome b5 reductase n=1 Tax=Neodothiora populina TaxID=2781224 RepID=A0ABR3PI53_9PEZI
MASSSTFVTRLTLPRALRFLAGATAIGLVGARYYANRKPIRLDSSTKLPPGSPASAAWNNLTPSRDLAFDAKTANKTLSFPRNMVFAKELSVVAVEQVNHDTKRITLSLPSREEISGVSAGGAILTQHTPSNRYFPVLRPYTTISDPSTPGEIQLLIKHYPSGAASTYMHSLQSGDKLTVRGPLPGSPTWTPITSSSASDSKTALFVAGGTGITPLYSLLHSVLKNENDSTRIHLVWGINTAHDIPLKKELDQLLQAHPEKLRITYCVSRDSADISERQDSVIATNNTMATFRKGYVDRAVLSDVLAQETKGKTSKIFFCGPPTMQSVLTGRKGIFKELGFEGKDVHVF